MQKVIGILKISPLFVLVALILFLSFSITSGFCEERHDNASNTGIAGIKEFLDYVESLPNFKTTIDAASRAGISISYKISEK